MVIKCGKEFNGSLINDKSLSAYNNNICSSPPPTPTTPPMFAFVLMAIVSGLSTILNSRGYSEHPSPVHLVISKKDKVIPLVIKADLEFSDSILIQLIIVDPNPNCVIVRTPSRTSILVGQRPSQCLVKWPRWGPGFSGSDKLDVVVVSCDL